MTVVSILGCSYRIKFILCAFMLSAAFGVNAAPTDGVVFWNVNDKHAGLSVSVDGMTVTKNPLVYEIYDEAGIRGNRPIYPGEGFYYFEVENVHRALFTAGVASASAPLNELAGFSTQMVGMNQDGRVGFNGGFSHPLDSPPSVVGVAVDYRGTTPIVHFMGGNNVYVDSINMTSVTGPVYLFLAIADYVGTAVEHRLNLGGSPYTLDPIAAIETHIYRGADGLQFGWPIDNDTPVVSVSGGDRVALEGDNILFDATAGDTESGDLSAAVEWYLDDVLAGTGSQLVISPSAGNYVLEARVEDAAELTATQHVSLIVTADSNEDHDYDGLSYADELLANTNPMLRDTDTDGLSDDREVAAGANPLVVDTDFDGMGDFYEVENGLDPTVDDTALDLDNDGFSNLAEFQDMRRANDANDFPGHAQVLLNTSDTVGAATLSLDGLSVVIQGAAASKSDVAVLPGSGWHYFEGTRYSDTGDYGFAIATASADLMLAAGANDQSIAVKTNGDVVYNGVVIQSFTTSTDVQTYGLAVDYTGLTPVVHVIIKRGREDYDLIAPISMVNISEPLFIGAFGEAPVSLAELHINTGANKKLKPFQYPVRYLMHRAGNSSAEFMRIGWGNAHVYEPLASVPYEDRIFMVKNDGVNEGLTLSEDKLGVSYTALRKSAVLANQGMIGEFRYWEAQRHIDIENIGFGFNNPYAFLDPYCCVNQGLNGGPPSMSVNAVGGIWRNLQHQFGYPSPAGTSYYGFAVDYRGSRPIVYVIMPEGVVGSLLLDDFITEIYPMLYGDGQGPVLTNSANFGAEPFHYNPAQALQDYGVDTTDFVPGWGIYQQYQQDNTPTPTPSPTPVASPSPVPVPSPSPTPVASSSPVPVPSPSPTPVASPSPVPVPSPSPTPIASPSPVPVPSPSPTPIASPSPVPVPSPSPTPVASPSPTPDGDYDVTIYGTNQDDLSDEPVYTVGSVSAHLLGLDGDDFVIGADAGDLLEGGRGNDYLEGGLGADIYYYNIGDGSDVIGNYDDGDVSGARFDTLLFGPGITSADIEVAQVGNNLVFTISITGDTITVERNFLNTGNGTYNYELGFLEFHDGTIFSSSILRGTLLGGTDANDTIVGYEEGDVIEGAGGDDTISGAGGNDFVFGNEDNDTLYGDAGNDRLGGGEGDDYLHGGTGNDIYMFEMGDGHDIIENYEDDVLSADRDDVLAFDGILPENVVLSREGFALIITVIPTGDSVTIPFHFLDIDGGFYSAISRISFSDGTSWNMSDIESILASGLPAIGRIEGGDGDDAVIGTQDDDVLVGGLGNDWLFGDLGNDLYEYNAGDGSDTIANLYADVNDVDVLSVTNISNTAFWFSSGADNSLIISFIGSADSITISSWFNDDLNQLDAINAGGVSIDRIEINALVAEMSVFSQPVDLVSIPQSVQDAVTAAWN